MEKRIDLEKRGRPAEEIRELNLDNCRGSQIEGLTEDFKNLESISLINVGLLTLKGFPNLTSLKRLELSDNRISGTLNLLQGCTNLQYLNLSGNKIKDIDALEPLTKLTNLKNLDLFNNEVTSMDDYREKVFKLLENLQYLDGFNRQDEEAEDEDGEEEDGEDSNLDDSDGEDEEDEEDSDEEEEDVGEEDDEEEDDGEDDEEEDDEEEVGLDYLTKDGIEDESEGEEYNPGQKDEADGEAADGDSRGTKRKHEDEDQSDS